MVYGGVGGVLEFAEELASAVSYSSEGVPSLLGHVDSKRALLLRFYLEFFIYLRNNSLLRSHIKSFTGINKNCTSSSCQRS